MRIAFFQPKLTWGGGVEVFLSSVLARLGRENQVAIFTFKFDPAALPKREGFDVRVVQAREDIDGHLKTYLRSRQRDRLLSELESWKPDIVIVQQYAAIRLCRWLEARLGGVPVIPYIHDLFTLRMLGEPESGKRRERMSALTKAYADLSSKEPYESKELGRTRLVACVSLFIKGHASRLWEGADSRVIYNGVDHDYFLPTWEDDGFVLCVSRIDRSKNLGAILDNFKDSTYPVVICGNVLKGNRYSEELADELRSRAKGPIRLMLNADPVTVRGLIQKCSLVVQPGKDEGFGLVPVEAMACGKPVIAHESGGTVEVVGDGGVLLGDNGAEWRKATDALMASPEERKELGRRALNRSMRFSWDRTAEELSDLCREAISRASRQPIPPVSEAKGKTDPWEIRTQEAESVATEPVVRAAARASSASSQGRVRNGGSHRFALAFSDRAAYPPNIHDMKCFYITRELLARGEKVTWLNLKGGGPRRTEGGIEFEKIPGSPTHTSSAVLSLFRMTLFCLSRRIRVVYMDDWLFFRNRPLRRLLGVAALRIVGIKVVLDERDPSVDFKIATGELLPGSPKCASTLRATRLTERMSNLILLTSKAYEESYEAEGFQPSTVFGSFRGIDTGIFNPSVESDSVRARLHLEGKFVVGWFGLMHRFRLIDEVLLPMIRTINQTIPDAHVLIGGEGPLNGMFQELRLNRDLPVTVLGLVPYDDLPRYIAACNVLLCPVNPEFRHTRNSAWLKIPEALAVGRPVIATRTRISDFDYKEMKGAVWVEPTLSGFMGALEEVHRNYTRYLSLAQEQAHNFDDYAVPHTIDRIVDRIEQLAGGPTGRR